MTQNMPSAQQQTTNGAAAAAAHAAGAPPALPAVCAELRRKVLAFLDTPAADERIKGTQEQTRVSLQVVEEALKRYKYVVLCVRAPGRPAPRWTPEWRGSAGCRLLLLPAAVMMQMGGFANVCVFYRFEELSLSYNGGKDCLCLLVLLLACLPTLTSNNCKTPTADGSLPRIQALYIAPADPFPEIEEFVAQSTQEYYLDLKQYTLSMRPALDEYLATTKSVKAMFMGTRRTDPHSEHLEHFSPTDAGWPQFMRVNPMIDWHYVDIWIVSAKRSSRRSCTRPWRRPKANARQFLRQLDIPYCNLYNLGYTSLGGTSNTKPNPKLALDAECTKFRPAYDLTQDEDERLGRHR